MAVIEPVCSSDSVWLGENENRSVTEELASKAAVNHVHADYAAEDHTHTGYALTTHTHSAYAAATHTHDMSGKADLVDGKVPESQLPSYVDDVVEYANLASFPSAGESGKVYVAQDTNKTYRWSGTTYVEIAGGVVLGETAATAHRGDHGAVAYAHSQNGDVHVTAAQKTAWDGKADGDHNHDTDYIAKSLQFTNDTGGVEYTFGENSGKNLSMEMAAWAQGFHTAYSILGTAGNPNVSESFRIFCHKTSDSIGWAFAFGANGSVYTNYCTNSAWIGWKPIYENAPPVLWSGSYYMNGNQTITPSKKLSECRNGWCLLWSDYDSATGAPVDGDVVATYIPKRCYNVENWTGHSWLFEIPTDVSSASPYAETRCIKKLYVWDDRIVGNAVNNQSPRNDVVLRAVYEF